MSKHTYIITNINPEPWAVGKAQAVRRKNGSLGATVSPNLKLQSYQNALRDEMSELDTVKYTGDVALSFTFWRQVEEGSTGSKKMSGHTADVTNLQKATEDALQGILYDNDNQVKFITSEILEQSTDTIPSIVISVCNMEDKEILQAESRRAEILRNHKLLEESSGAEDRMKW